MTTRGIVNSVMFRNLVLRSTLLHGQINRNVSIIKKSGSFLSDREGVKNFVELLGVRERRLLAEELHSRENEKAPASTDPPTAQQLRLIFFHQSLPYLGFGFLDNLIMILAGDYIETTVGVALGITTMAAAGLGNAVSDVAGIGSAWYVEKLAGKIGTAYPKLSEAQQEMPRTRWCIQLARILGITMGCIIGMFPLLFLPSNKEKKDEKKAEKSTT